MAIGFAVVARTMGAVTDGGALVGVMVAFVLMLAAGLAGFVPLATVFLLTVVTTQWGYARKQRLGVAERRRGRTASQVLANLCAAALLRFAGDLASALQRRSATGRDGGAGRGRCRYGFQRTRTGDSGSART